MSSRCPECGSVMPEVTGEAGCPACLLEMAIEEDPAPTRAGRSAAGQGATSEGHGPGSAGPESRAGQQVGPYRLVRRLGEGGMGEVWLADQQSPIQRTVAVKIIKLGMDTAAVVARFEVERQTLALMEHPHIARVFEAGATSTGRPFFSMEYVKGDALTVHCDRHRLSLSQRIDLFQDVCAGVQHAHQHGIIHRDLKPGNVLVQETDGRQVPKIIDFGVAKATAKRLTEHSLFTDMGIVIGTPEFMSPEQTDPFLVHVDTRSDVYSLGVMLYQLTTGFLPFGSTALRESGYEEARRCIREETPPRPSIRLRMEGEEQVATVARDRGVSTSRLRHALRGDLDWIIMRALEKDPDRRYQSPQALADDLRRHVEHRPVKAGPPSLRYRFGRFVRRHLMAVGISLAALIVVTGFMVMVTTQAGRLAVERDRANAAALEASQAAREAAEEARTAERTTDFLVRMFEFADPGEAPGRDITAREILDRGTREIRRSLAHEPEVRGRLLAIIGDTYDSLGHDGTAIAIMEEAIRVQEAHLGATHPQVAHTLTELANLLADRQEVERAGELALRAYAILQDSPQAPALEKVRASLTYAGVLLQQNDVDSAQSVLEQAQTQLLNTVVPPPFDLQSHDEGLSQKNGFRIALAELSAEVVRRQGDAEKSLALMEEVLPLYERLEDEGGYLSPRSSYYLRLAWGYAAADEPERARTMMSRYRQRMERLYGSGHWMTGVAMIQSGLLHGEFDHYHEALSDLQQALTIMNSSGSLVPPVYRRLAQENMATALAELGQEEAGLQVMENLLQAGGVPDDADSPERFHQQWRLALLHMQRGGVEQARSFYDPIVRASYEPYADTALVPSRMTTRAFSRLARLVGQAGDQAAAMRLYEIAANLWQARNPGDAEYRSLLDEMRVLQESLGAESGPDAGRRYFTSREAKP